MALPSSSPADEPKDSSHEVMESAARPLMSSSAAFIDLI